MTPPDLHIEREERDMLKLEAKLDQILAILHGDGKQEMGMVQKVNLLWMMVFKWPLYLLSLGAGSLITILIQRFSK